MLFLADGICIDRCRAQLRMFHPLLTNIQRNAVYARVDAKLMPKPLLISMGRIWDASLDHNPLHDPPDPHAAEEPDWGLCLFAGLLHLSDPMIHADTVIANLEAMLRDLDAQISEMEARAAKGPDGQPVFTTADGRVVDASGRTLPSEIAAGIIWPPGVPSAEDYFRAKKRHAETETLLDDWRDYRTGSLGSLRDRHSDRDAPMSKDELRKALEQIQTNAPATAKIAIQEPDSAATQSAKLDTGAVPTALR